MENFIFCAVQISHSKLSLIWPDLPDQAKAYMASLGKLGYGD